MAEQVTIKLYPTRRVTFHTVQVGTCVWARKVTGGEWFPATVVRVGRNIAQVEFENGRLSQQRYSWLCLRFPGRKGIDRPARVQLP